MLMLDAAEAASGSMSSVVTKLTTGITADTIFAVVAEVMPYVITMVPVALGIYILRRVINGSAKAKVRF